MDLGETDKVRPLIKEVREMVNDEIAPMETEFQEKLGGRENVSSSHLG